MKPQFTPAGGIGSKYVDPKTKQEYVFSSAGWLTNSKNIKEEVKETDTFEVKPDEQKLVEALKAGGSTPEQINQGLAERRRIQSNLGISGDVAIEDPESDVEILEGDVPWDDYVSRTEELLGRDLNGAEKNELRQQYNADIVGQAKKEPTSDSSHPFGGMSKKEVLRDAFSKGVTSTSELKKLETLYEILVDEDEVEDDFTATERRKLEQAGLTNATRQEKLDHLYGDEFDF